MKFKLDYIYFDFNIYSKKLCINYLWNFGYEFFRKYGICCMIR